jgi:hypothetical protein
MPGAGPAAHRVASRLHTQLQAGNTVFIICIITEMSYVAAVAFQQHGDSGGHGAQTALLYKEAISI